MSLKEKHTAKCEIEEYEDGVFIDFGGKPYDVEYHDAGVQIWRDRAGRIVAIDIVYEDAEYENEESAEKKSL